MYGAVRVPLLGSARRIIDERRIEGAARLLPALSNQAANRYLTEVCRLADIKDPVSEVRLIGREKRVVERPKCEAISMHAARKTFITLSLEDGVLEPVDLLGFTHDDLTTLKLYKGKNDAALRVKMQTVFAGL